jgi:hypothetical protein
MNWWWSVSSYCRPRQIPTLHEENIRGTIGFISGGKEKKRGREWVLQTLPPVFATIIDHKGKVLEGVWNSNCRYGQRAKTPHTHHYFHNDFLVYSFPPPPCYRVKKERLLCIHTSYKSEGLNLREKVHRFLILRNLKVIELLNDKSTRAEIVMRAWIF